MPDSTDVNLEELLGTVKEKIESHEAVYSKHEIVPVAFGLKSLNVTLHADEDKGSLDPLEEEIAGDERVASCSVISVSRALG